MINITARINVSENGGTINSATINAEKINVSADIDKILGKKNVVIGNPFILGESRLDSGAYYTDSLPYFISRDLSNNNGIFPQSYTITIIGKDITQFVIAFDTANGAFPNSIIVDGETVYDDDHMWEVNVETADTHTIVISNWNKPNSPLIITGIYADINIDIDRHNLLSFNSDIIDRTTSQEPVYGIVSNSASLRFSDLKEETLDLITQQILHSSIKVEVWLNNTDSKEQEQICLMQIRELSYDNDNRAVQVSLKDNLEEWQDINIDAINYDPLNGEPKTAQWFYEELHSKTPSIYNMLSFEELDDDTREVLSGTTIQYPLLESSSLWDSWQKLCELCLLHIYVDYEGKTVCKYNNGN